MLQGPIVELGNVIVRHRTMEQAMEEAYESNLRIFPVLRHLRFRMPVREREVRLVAVPNHLLVPRGMMVRYIDTVMAVRNSSRYQLIDTWTAFELALSRSDREELAGMKVAMDPVLDDLTGELGIACFERDADPIKNQEGRGELGPTRMVIGEDSGEPGHGYYSRTMFILALT